MNEELIKFIELCLSDGVITEKEREVIFRKSKELGVPDDECEILIDSLVSKYSKKTSPPKPTKKKGGFFSSMFNEIKKNIDTDSIKSSFNKVKDDIKKGYDIEKEKIEKELKKTTSSNKPSKTKITSPKSVNTNKPSSSKFYSCDEVDIIVKYPESMEDGRVYDLSGNRVYKISKTMREKSFKNKSYLGRKEFDSGTIRWVEINPDEVENKLNDSEFIEVHSLDNKLKTPSKKKVGKEKSIENNIPILIEESNSERIIKQIQSVIENKYLLTDNKLSIVSSSNYNEVLQQNQKKIIEVDKSYVQKFVKIGLHLKFCEDNIVKCYNRVLNGEIGEVFISCEEFLGKDKEGLITIEWKSFIEKISKETGNSYEESKKIWYDTKYGKFEPPHGVYVSNPKKINYTTHLKTIQDHINIYEQLLITSITMINSLINNDLIKFYEIYEVFDNLGVFDSKWERSLLESIKDINQNINQVVSNINKLNQNIMEGFQGLSYDLHSIDNSLTDGFSRITS